MNAIQPVDTCRTTVSQLVREAKDVIQFEDDPHRAALEDNPERTSVSLATFASIGFLTLSFGPALGLGFVTIASVAQQITIDLGSPQEATWVVGAWSLASAVSYSLAGPLSDVFGRRWPILIGQALTIVGCVVAAVAKNVPTLIVGEAIVGVSTGLLFVAYAGVPEMLPNKWRAVSLGVLEGGIAIPWGIIAVILGNALYYHATWRWIFYIAIIVEAVALVGTALTYWPRPHPRGDYEKSRWQEFKEIDFGGLFLFTGGLTTLLIGLTWGGTEAYPWKSAGTLVPIILGFITLIATIVYDSKVPQNPMYPWSLFTNFRQYGCLLVVVFVAGMSFYPMASLLPRGYFYMFTTDPIEIGVYSLPTTIVQCLASVVGPIFAHKVGYVKWQLFLVLLIQTVFLSASVASVYPNKRLAFIFLPAFGPAWFPWIAVLAYAIASLHVPHSRLGLAMGLIGSVRAAGGAVGNAILATVLNDRFQAYVGPEVTKTALQNGLNPQYLPQIIPGAIQYNIHIPGALEGVPGMTPAIQEALRFSVRTAYGHAYRMVFYITIPFSVVALICSLFVEDATKYMTNHTQFFMSKDMTTHRRQYQLRGEKAEVNYVHVEAKADPVKEVTESPRES